ncbi:MAG: aldehyde dehydrogenase family protein [Bacteroidia bacterium]|nr:aldehyde dehydrogenase family protein [Bacteroidia bacterium]MDW8332836.1 aldehyde dehydrogenase family protein [Bacteroidia bacterium]
MRTIYSPLDGKKLYDVEDGNVEEAYALARKASGRIASIPPRQRAQYCKKLQHCIVEHREAILDRIVAETGKSRFDALASEIFAALDVIHFYAERGPALLRDRVLPFNLAFLGKTSKICYEPLGVVLIISPWNYPFYQAIVPIVNAFIAGNAVIYKPSEVTPLKGLVEEILQKSGFPADAVQVVYGGKDVGQRLVEARPDKIFFTGSRNAGKKIMETAARNLTPLELELGGKDPMIVFEDVNLERTVNGALWGALTACGQSCTSVERLYVHEAIFEPFQKMLEQKLARLRTAVPGEDVIKNLNLDVGVMTARFQSDVVRRHVEAAVSQGAAIFAPREHQSDHHLAPMLLTRVTHQMEVMVEETFGPVLPMTSFRTEDEVVAMANDSPYGLSASVWSKDLVRAERVARAIKTGNVSINNVMYTEANPALPFGGIKDSGFGRYKGELGLYTFCNVKSVLIDKQSSKIEPHWFPYTPEKYAALSKLIDAMFSPRASLFKFISAGLKFESLAQKQKL